MQIHIDSVSGFVLLFSHRQPQGRHEGHVYFPSPQSTLNPPLIHTHGNIHGHVLVKSAWLARLCEKLRQASVSLQSKLTNGTKRASVRSAREWKAGPTRLLFVGGTFLWAATTSPAQETPDLLQKGAAPSYAGYNFSLPFRFEVFLKKKVPESLPFAKAKTFVLPELPAFAFLKMPSHVADGEQAFLLTPAAWADALEFSNGPLVRRRLTSEGSCGSAKVYAAKAGEFVVIPGDSEALSGILVSPPDLDILCPRAHMVTDNAT